MAVMVMFVVMLAVMPLAGCASNPPAPEPGPFLSTTAQRCFDRGGTWTTVVAESGITLGHVCDTKPAFGGRGF